MKKWQDLRTDLIIDNNNINSFNKNKIKIFDNKNNYYYKTIFFSDLVNMNKLKKVFKEQLSFFINNKKYQHFFIVGLGNDGHTADSVGSKVIKNIEVNSHLEKLGINLNHVKISALEPGVLGQTGIDTKKIIESVVSEIKPDIVILIDSYVSKNIEYLNHVIQITNEGITPGSGLKSINSKISCETLGIPVIIIGVVTAIEIKFVNNNNYHFLSTKDIDDYVIKISKIIGEGINEILYHI